MTHNRNFLGISEALDPQSGIIVPACLLTPVLQAKEDVLLEPLYHEPDQGGKASVLSAKPFWKKGKRLSLVVHRNLGDHLDINRPPLINEAG